MGPQPSESDAPRPAGPVVEASGAFVDQGSFAALLEAAPDAVLVVDRRGRIVLANAQARTLFGYAPGELLGRAVEDLVPDAVRAAHVKHRAAYADDPGIRPMGVGMPLHGLRRDGAEFPVDISLGTFDTAGGPLVVAFVRDDSERRRLLEERRAFELQLLETERLTSLGLLAGGVAHDFNNLLAVVLGNASLAQMALEEGTEPRAEIDQIIRATRQAGELTRQMLAYAGKGRYVVEPVRTSNLVRDMVELIASTIAKRAVLELSLDDTDEPTIEADVNQLRQVVLNLITNACDALGDHSGTIRVSTGTVDADRNYLALFRLAEAIPEGRYVFLEVSDTGPGMDAETQSRIFDPFFTTKETGRGLGLAAVLGIVRGHQGAIKLYSAPGLGTTFKLLFPVSGRPEAARTELPEVDGFRGTGTVLVADDEEPVRAMAGRLLGSLGFEVVHATDGREALRAIDEAVEPFAFVLLDLMMPGLDGTAVLEELERRGATTPIVICSGYNAQDLSQRFTQRGIATFLQKPYSLAELRQIAEAIALGHPPGAAPAGEG